MQSIYSRLLDYIKPYGFLLITSLISSLIYVVMNSASIWMIGSLISKIMLPKTIESNIDFVSNNYSTSLNQKLNLLTENLIGTGSPIEQLKTICILLLIIFILKNMFFYINHLFISFIQFLIIAKTVSLSVWSTYFPISFNVG